MPIAVPTMPPSAIGGVEHAVTCRTSPAALRCSGTRRRSSRRPRRRPRRCRRARASRPSPSAAPGSWSSRASPARFLDPSQNRDAWRAGSCRCAGMSLVDVLEHRRRAAGCGRRQRAVADCACFSAAAPRLVDLLLHGRCSSSDQAPSVDQGAAPARDRVAEREARQSSAGGSATGSSRSSAHRRGR